MYWGGGQKRQGCEFKVSLVCTGSSRTARDTEQRDPVSKSKTEKTTCGMAVLKAIYVLSPRKKKSLYLRNNSFQDGIGELERWLSDQGHVLLL